jgi:hypothetical protein
MMIPATWFIAMFVSLLGTAFVLERTYAKRQARLGRLICNYSDYETARRVFRREIRQGQTETQILDWRGEPARKNRPPRTPSAWIAGCRPTRYH